MMKIEDYQALAMRTSPEGHDRVMNGSMGLIGESGEIMDVVKKWKFQSGENAELPKDKLIDKCGDVLWYCAELCEGLNESFAGIVKEHRQNPMQFKDVHSISDLAYCLTLICARPYGMLCCECSLEADRYPMNSRRPDCFRNICAIVALVSRILINFCDFTLEEAMERNVEKLKKRYPDGFDPERSLHRPGYEIVGEEINEYANPSRFLFEMRNRTI